MNINDDEYYEIDTPEHERTNVWTGYLIVLAGIMFMGWLLVKFLIYIA